MICGSEATIVTKPVPEFIIHLSEYTHFFYKQPIKESSLRLLRK